MSKKKEAKKKKLRKKHIVPSIIRLILGVLVSVILTLAIIFLFMSFALEMKLTQASEQTAYVTELVKNCLNDGMSIEDTVATLQSRNYTGGAVYILDTQTMEALGGYGGATYDLLDTSIFDEFSIEGLYRDTQKHGSMNEFLEKDKVLPFMKQVFSDKDLSYVGMQVGEADANGGRDGINLSVSIVGDDAWMNSTVYSGTFWFSQKITDTPCTVMVQHHLMMARKDIIYIMSCAVFALLLSLIPTIGLFVSVVNSIVTYRRLTKIANTSTETMGYNMTYYLEKSTKTVRQLWNRKKSYAVVSIELLKYQRFCTYYGVEAGEQLLENIDRTIRAMLKHNEICAQQHGATFVLFLKPAEDVTIQQRIRDIITRIDTNTGAHRTVFHAGIYRTTPTGEIPNHKLDMMECYNRASIARKTLDDDNMHEIAFFDRKMTEEQLWEQKVEESMVAALERGEFEVYIQPKYNPSNDELQGAEALVRWISPTEGFLGPGRFIPIFENNGFITHLDDYMISHVAALQAQWIAEGRQVVPISVNVSRIHFMKPDLAEHICRLVDAYAVPHKFIEIELTESAFFDDQSMLLNTVEKLHEAGFEVSMDDFGSGYSSLNSLKDLPLDVLKLDAGFFRGKGVDENPERSRVVVTEAIHLAKQLDMEIVAEGVEKKEQVEFLAGCGCDMIQGYYYAKPMPAAEYAERMHRVAGEPVQTSVSSELGQVAGESMQEQMPVELVQEQVSGESGQVPVEPGQVPNEQ